MSAYYVKLPKPRFKVHEIVIEVPKGLSLEEIEAHVSAAAAELSVVLAHSVISRRFDSVAHLQARARHLASGGAPESAPQLGDFPVSGAR